MERQIINPWRWQDAYGFVQANEVSDAQRVLYCAGQVSVDAEGNPLHPGDMSAQIAQSLDNLETVLDNAGFEMSDVVRLNFYTTMSIAPWKRGRPRLKTASHRVGAVR